MEAHYEARHPGIPIPSALLEEVAKGVHEVAWCASLLVRKSVPQNLDCKKVDFTCEGSRKRKRKQGDSYSHNYE